ncbi:conserved hypothetical protein [Mesorhizobium metallidurans STM 2683]|uniref:DUF3606 domain-containing protein n=1 Tax=Mesorhizobium metallidurans STM 2683 TaxID=1297569 RepID=M5EMZ7_9HYPH|nr:conserved hypothetical protein [Mesorhizobium metallidurans STM 2683]
MAHDNDKQARPAEHEPLAQSLASETGISEEQARELIRLIGTDRNSLLREARQLLRQRPR